MVQAGVHTTQLHLVVKCVAAPLSSEFDSGVASLVDTEPSAMGCVFSMPEDRSAAAERSV